ncbi:MAG TPA: hypothetical protein EYG39_11750 [Rhodothermales bacterium]|nr:hypothetical protein [Rhodothermales bacterium]
MAAALCALALAPLPYGYYTLLRIAVTAAAGYGAVLAWESEDVAWAIGLGLLAAAFNPIIPVHLSRGAWAAVDLAAAAALAAAGVRSKRWAEAP